MIRAMSPDEEVNLAAAVMCRDLFSMEAGVQAAGQSGLPSDLVNLLRAGISCVEIDREMEGEEIEPGESEYRYVWSLPQPTGSAH